MHKRKMQTTSHSRVAFIFWMACCSSNSNPQDRLLIMLLSCHRILLLGTRTHNAQEQRVVAWNRMLHFAPKSITDSSPKLNDQPPILISTRNGAFEWHGTGQVYIHTKLDQKRLRHRSVFRYSSQQLGKGLGKLKALCCFALPAASSHRNLTRVSALLQL